MSGTKQALTQREPGTVHGSQAEAGALSSKAHRRQELLLGLLSQRLGLMWRRHLAGAWEAWAFLRPGSISACSGRSLNPFGTLFPQE